MKDRCYLRIWLLATLQLALVFVDSTQAFQKPAVIFVAPFDDDETRWVWTETIQRGAYEFLPKPLDPPELNRVLVQAIEKHHPMQPRKRPPAESVRDVTPKARKRATSQN